MEHSDDPLYHLRMGMAPLFDSSAAEFIGTNTIQENWNDHQHSNLYNNSYEFNNNSYDSNNLYEIPSYMSSNSNVPFNNFRNDEFNNVCTPVPSYPPPPYHAYESNNAVLSGSKPSQGTYSPGGYVRSPQWGMSHGRAKLTSTQAASISYEQPPQEHSSVPSSQPQTQVSAGNCNQFTQHSTGQYSQHQDQESSANQPVQYTFTNQFNNPHTKASITSYVQPEGHTSSGPIAQPYTKASATIYKQSEHTSSRSYSQQDTKASASTYNQPLEQLSRGPYRQSHAQASQANCNQFIQHSTGQYSQYQDQESSVNQTVQYPFTNQCNQPHAGPWSVPPPSHYNQTKYHYQQNQMSCNKVPSNISVPSQSTYFSNGFNPVPQTGISLTSVTISHSSVYSSTSWYSPAGSNYQNVMHEKRDLSHGTNVDTFPIPWSPPPRRGGRVRGRGRGRGASTRQVKDHIQLLPQLHPSYERGVDSPSRGHERTQSPATFLRGQRETTPFPVRPVARPEREQTPFPEITSSGRREEISSWLENISLPGSSMKRSREETSFPSRSVTGDPRAKLSRTPCPSPSPRRGTDGDTSRLNPHREVQESNLLPSVRPVREPVGIYFPTTPCQEEIARSPFPGNVCIKSEVEETRVPSAQYQEGRGMEPFTSPLPSGQKEKAVPGCSSQSSSGINTSQTLRIPLSLIKKEIGIKNERISPAPEPAELSCVSAGGSSRSPLFSERILENPSNKSTLMNPVEKSYAKGKTAPTFHHAQSSVSYPRSNRYQTRSKTRKSELLLNSTLQQYANSKNLSQPQLAVPDRYGAIKNLLSLMTCPLKSCNEFRCKELKSEYEHLASCSIWHESVCYDCQRIIALSVHGVSCSAAECPEFICKNPHSNAAQMENQLQQNTPQTASSSQPQPTAFDCDFDDLLDIIEKDCRKNRKSRKKVDELSF